MECLPRTIRHLFTVFAKLVAPFVAFLKCISIMGGKRRRPHQDANIGSDRSNRNWREKYAHDYTKDYSDARWPYASGRLDWSAKVIIIAVPLVIASLTGYFKYMSDLREMVRTPLDAPKMVSPTATLAVEDPERFWGTYRSNVYFGMKTRSPNSPVMGLMWMPQFTRDMPPKVRHWCDQGDDLPMYSWLAHDGVNFGIQEVIDQYYTISMSVVKRPGGDHGGDWTAGFSVKPRPGAETMVMSLFFYVALDGDGHIQADMDGDRLGAIHGYSSELGNFKVTFPKSVKNLKYSNYLVTHAPGLESLKQTMMSGFRLMKWKGSQKNVEYLALGGRMYVKDKPNEDFNFMVHQVTVTLPYEMEVLFESGSNSDRPNILSSRVFADTLQSHLTKFEQRFDQTFGLESKGFGKEQIAYAKAALSNMLGGIGYFYGHSLVKSKYNKDQPLKYWDAPLYTGVPSRSFFPRGFLWDEGFHNLLISKWDQKISMDIISHWLDLMNVEGWIPREQILGNEARARVPAEFVVQHNENANPPTLFLPLQKIVKNLIQSHDPKDKLFLKNLFPRLKTWYQWFNTTQSGPQDKTYRWRGRDVNSKFELNPKTLTSGLDDYPRASHPTDSEYHLDLRCWMALASGVMADIAKSLGEKADDYISTYSSLMDNKLLDQLHWSEKSQRYSDYGLHTNALKLERPRPPPPASGQRAPNPAEMQKVRGVKKEPVNKFVDSFGYVSLFPFLLKVVEPNSLKLGKILQDLQDPNLLWTKYGLRSLAKNAPLYGKHNTEHDPPYWRGAIWININYLAVGALHHYSITEGPHQEEASRLYQELRQNLITNIMSQYNSSGYIWEQYDDKTGHGKGSHPFTGWSALVVAMMAELF